MPCPYKQSKARVRQDRQIQFRMEALPEGFEDLRHSNFRSTPLPIVETIDSLLRFPTKCSMQQAGPILRQLVLQCPILLIQHRLRA